MNVISRKWEVFVAEVAEPFEPLKRDFSAAGCKLRMGRSMMDGTPYSEDEMVDLVKGVDALMGGSRETYTRRILESAPGLRILSKFGTGLERIDLKAATLHGILGLNTTVYSLGVAETTVAYILALAKKLKPRDRGVAAGTWRSVGYEQMTGMLLKDKVVCIIGFGRAGATVARLLEPWGVKLLAYDPWKSHETGVPLDVRLTTLDRLLKESDFVTVLAAATPETRKMIGEDEFRVMKKTAYFINTARGMIVDEKALIRALRKGIIAGAALDVFDPEPPRSDNPLLTEFSDRVWLAPHAAAYAPEIRGMMLSAWVDNCLKALRGEIPQYTVNREAIPKWQERIADSVKSAAYLRSGRR